MLDRVHYLVHYVTMIRLNIHEAKTHLSRYIERVLEGEVIVLCRRNVPVAEIRAIPPGRQKPRKFGQARGKFTLSPAFNDPLPEDELRDWINETETE